jgi:L-malate glycosyltransferase
MKGSPAAHDGPASGTSPRALRIVLCVDSLAAGGTELNAVRTAEQLRLRGHEATLLVLEEKGPLVQRCREQGVPVLEFPIPPVSRGGMVRRGPALLRLLRGLEPEIIHTQDCYTNAFIVPWARVTGARVLASRRWWDLHPSRKIKAGNRLAFKLAHRVVANSDRVAELVRTVDGVAARRISVIPNFLDEWAVQQVGREERVRLRSLLDVPADATVIGCVANLRPVKAHDVLLSAMALLTPQFPTLVLVLVGDGAARPALERQAQQLGIRDRVIFAGSRSAPVNWHVAFDVSVLASLSEGFPNTVVEAMAAGRAVVATDVGGTRDAIRDGVNGLLVPAGSADLLATALKRVLDDSPLAAAFGQAARAEARSRFQAAAVIPKLEALYLGELSARHMS